MALKRSSVRFRLAPPKFSFSKFELISTAQFVRLGRSDSMKRYIYYSVDLYNFFLVATRFDYIMLLFENEITQESKPP